jgi:hypothetical protein
MHLETCVRKAQSIMEGHVASGMLYHMLGSQMLHRKCSIANALSQLLYRMRAPELVHVPHVR